MKTFLVSRTDQIDWNEYDAFVVRAEDEETALELCEEWGSRYGKELFTIDNVEIKDVDTIKESGFVLASFNAG